MTGLPVMRSLSSSFYPSMLYFVLFNLEVFFLSTITRPLWVQYPKDTETFELEDQFLLGSDLLIKPVTDKGVEYIDVYFPKQGVYIIIFN
jgi:hypothetical protein